MPVSQSEKDDAFQVLNIEAKDIQSYGGLTSTAFFNNIFVDQAGKIVLQWNLRNRLDPGIRDYSTMSFNEDGSEAALKLIANPIIQQVGCYGTNFLTLENQRLRRWKSNDSFTSVLPDGMIKGRFRQFSIAKETGLVIALSHDGKTTSVFSINQPDQRKEASPVQEGLLRSVYLDRKGTTAVIGTQNGKVAYWNLANDEVQSVNVGEFAVLDLDSSADGQTLMAIVDNDADESTRAGYATVIRPNAETGSWTDPVQVRVDAPGSDAITSGDISQDGLRLITGSVRGQVTLWNTKSQVGNENSTDQVQDQRELLNLFQCQSEVVDVNIANSDSQIFALERRATEGSGWLLQTSK